MRQNLLRGARNSITTRLWYEFSSKSGIIRGNGQIILKVFHGVMLPSSGAVPMHFGIIFKTAI